jgi:dihydrofolate synthase/folylpolyglutamate synthase
MFDPNPELDALLQKLLHPQLKVIDPSLERIERLMAALGNPQFSLPPVIHVAGTNGKGSLIAYLRAILKAAGYRVHSYISPHLVRFNERILLDDEEISTGVLTPILERILAMQNDYPATFFEATTAAAFLAFAAHPADIILLETGMGGRLDATNIIPNPAVVAITPIGMDHAEFLGNSIAKIAAEKAGIIKLNCPVVMGLQVPEAAAVIAAKAQKMDSPFIAVGVPTSWPHAMPVLVGEHQLANAAIAIAVVNQLRGFAITQAHINEGLKTAKWAARLQPLKSGYWREQLPEGWQLFLDGGHNPHAAAAIATWANAQNVPIYLVLGMLNNKDLVGYLQHWQGRVQQVYGVTIPHEKHCYSAQQIDQIAQQQGFDAVAADSVEAALEKVKSLPTGIVLICGSLYLAGHILAEN